jgi:type IV fimbrial biogenesis protein FimT
MTIIELLIGLVLVALLLALGVPSFATAMQNRQIRSAADALNNGLQLARTEALRRNRAVKFELVGTSGWNVGCDPADATIVNDEEVCPALLQTRDAADTTPNASVATTQVVAATGSAAASPVFAGTLRFTSLGRVAPATLPAGNNAVFDITNPNGGVCAAGGGDMRCLSVVVTPGGQIRTCDPAVSDAGDPRKC